MRGQLGAQVQKPQETRSEEQKRNGHGRPPGPWPGSAIPGVAIELQGGERRSGERDPRIEAEREHVPDQWNRSEDLGERPQRHGHAEAADHERQQRPGQARARRAGSEHQKRRRPAHDAEVSQGHLRERARDSCDLRHVDEVSEGARKERRGDAAPERRVRSERERAAPVRQRREDHPVRSPDGECGGEKEESGQAGRRGSGKECALHDDSGVRQIPQQPAQADPQRREEHAESERLRMSPERGPGEYRSQARDGAPAALGIAATLQKKQHPGPETVDGRLRKEDPLREPHRERPGDGSKYRSAGRRLELPQPQPHPRQRQQELDARRHEKRRGERQPERREREGRKGGRRAVRSERRPRAVPAVPQREASPRRARAARPRSTAASASRRRSARGCGAGPCRESARARSAWRARAEGWSGPEEMPSRTEESKARQTARAFRRAPAVRATSKRYAPRRPPPRAGAGPQPR